MPILDSSLSLAALPFVTAAPATAVVLAAARVIVVFLCLRGTDPASRPAILRALAELGHRRGGRR